MGRTPETIQKTLEALGFDPARAIFHRISTGTSRLGPGFVDEDEFLRNVFPEDYVKEMQRVQNEALPECKTPGFLGVCFPFFSFFRGELK